MEKKSIETFIKKYTLAGSIEGVLWQNVNNNLSVTAMTGDRKLFASVQSENSATFFTGVEIGIQDTNKLRKMLAPLSDNISLTLDVDEKDATRVRKLTADDGKISIDYVTAAKDVIDPSPTMKSLPPFTVELTLTPKFVDGFSKAFSALSDDKLLFTFIMSKKKNKLEMVLGYKSNLSDRIAMEVDAVSGKDVVSAPISFNAKHLKEILTANSEVENPILSVSEAGLASIKFDSGDFKSQYYLVKIDVED